MSFELAPQSSQELPTHLAFCLQLLRSSGFASDRTALRETPDSQAYEEAENWNRSCLDFLVAGDFEQGMRSAGRALTLLPMWFEPYHHMSYALAQLGQLDKAIDFSKACIQIYPFYDPAHHNLISALLKKDDREAALQASLEMEAYFPGSADNLFRIGTLYLRSGQYEQAQEWLDRGLNTRIPQKVSRMLPFGRVTQPKLIHDLAQLEYLMDQEVLPPSFHWVAGEYRRLIHESPQPAPAVNWSSEQDWQPCTQRLSKIAPFYRRILHLHPAPRLSGPTIRDSLDLDSAHKTFQNRRPFSYLILDEFLTGPALEALRDYLLRSTIWHNDAQKGRTYLGAYKDMGLRCPLMDQIIEELNLRFADFLGTNRLEEIWAYRHILGEKAIGAHADFSEINFNIWLTPDEANRAPQGGGLILYQKAVPQDWDFETYNDNLPKINNFLRETDTLRIPYRENRMVLFDPRLFHASDVTHFGSSLNEMRVNLTFLFGDRSQTP